MSESNEQNAILSDTNPYAPPTITSEHQQQLRQQYPLTGMQLLKVAGVCTLITIGTVLPFQIIFRGILNWPLRSFPFIAIESIAFGAPVVALLFLLGYLPGRGDRDQADEQRALGAFIACSMLALCGFGAGQVLIRHVTSINGLPQLVVVSGLPYVAVLAAVLFMQRVEAKLSRTIASSVMAPVIWLALAFLTVAAVIEPLPPSLQDYMGFTLLTVFWIWSAILHVWVATGGYRKSDDEKETLAEPREPSGAQG